MQKEIIVGQEPNGHLVTIKVELSTHNKNNRYTVHGTFYDSITVKTLSMSGSYSGGGGQCQESIRRMLKDGEFKPLVGAQIIEQMLDIWDEYHLNDMAGSGTSKQEECLAKWKASEQFNPSLKDVDVLQVHGLNPDNGVYWGRQWMLRIIPEEVVEIIKGWERLIPLEVEESPIIILVNSLAFDAKFQGCSRWKKESKSDDRKDYLVTITNKEGVSAQFDFHQGMGIKENPQLQGVLSCLVNDYTYGNDTPIGELTDGLSFVEAKEMLDALQSNKEKLEQLFSKEELELLINNQELLECQLLFKQ